MKLALKFIIPLVVLVAAFGLAKKMIASKPPLESQKPPTVIPTVSTLTIDYDTHSPPVHSFGTVKSYFETAITAQVNGNITFVADTFRVGRKVRKGDTLARIDTTDYQAILARESAVLSTNKRTLEEETIRSKQAEEDWKASGRQLSSASAFVLRKPQLAAALASIASSEAAINKAQADIDRCTLKAPFDAVISARSASIGNFATPQTDVGTLVATEMAEIKIPLTPEQAARIELPNQSTAPHSITLTSPTKPGSTWTALLTRTVPVIDPTNQVVFVIAEIAHPYDGKESLPIGTFVNASIPSKEIPKAMEIPELALVNDAYLWAVDSEMKLVKINAKRLLSHNGMAYVKLVEPALTPPLTIISRPLTNFRTGMSVKTDKQ
ncbi:MAG: efflux RND transporter periplasmic adaptor subunit [Rubritalea sp.]|uniref:efflux RND transporter periplasmic adaptor subunit n=1 Tax=Rubritalea sp. TaxID=2109375 RepID=UPI0032422D43